MGAHAQRLTAINGTMTDNQAFNWQTLNTDDQTTTLATNLGRPTFIELDLGVGGQLADNVRIVHPTGNMAASNNTVLYVMNEQRMIILQNVFTITPDSKQTENFAINAAIPPAIAPADIKMVRYIQMVRLRSSGSINLNCLQVYLGSHTRIYLLQNVCECNQRYFATDGIITPLGNPSCNFRYLNDGVSKNTVSSTSAAQGYMQLDFGVNGVPANSVRVGMAIGAAWIPVRNTNGLTLVAIDPAGNQLFVYTFGDIGVNGNQFYNFNMSGQLISSGN